MRTTVKLDQDVLELLHRELLRTRQSLERTVNDALRKTYSKSGNGKPKRKLFKVRPLPGKLRKGIDPERLKDYLYQEDEEHFLRVLEQNSQK